MNNRMRELANSLVTQSTVDGKLNLDQLSTNTTALARRLAEQDPNWADYNRMGKANDVVNRQVQGLTVATREVLGIIPKEQWRHETGSALTNAMERAQTSIAGHTEPTHGLNCSRVNGQDLSSIQPNAPLRQQGVECTSRGNSR